MSDPSQQELLNEDGTPKDPQTPWNEVPSYDHIQVIPTGVPHQDIWVSRSAEGLIRIRIPHREYITVPQALDLVRAIRRVAGEILAGGSST